MKKLLSLVMLMSLAGCSNANGSKSNDEKNAAEWCYEKIKEESKINIDHWTTQDLNSNDEKAQFNYLITTWYTSSGYPVRIEWNCDISFNSKGTNETVYPKSAITYINVERLCVIEGRR